VFSALPRGAAVIAGKSPKKQGADRFHGRRPRLEK
jgi:hypothetical protein